MSIYGYSMAGKSIVANCAFSNKYLIIIMYGITPVPQQGAVTILSSVHCKLQNNLVRTFQNDTKFVLKTVEHKIIERYNLMEFQ
jgi:hypothetical protein